MADSLKLISLNIEAHKHLDLQVPFFRAESPDVLCLQEVFESDFHFLKKELGMDGSFAPMCTMRHDENEKGEKILEPLGVAVLTRFPSPAIKSRYYFGDAHAMHEYVGGTVTQQKYLNKVLLYGEVSNADGVQFCIGTTHFTWTPDGAANENQRQDLRALFKELETIPEIVLCGDFNAPRGGEIFSALAEKYKDNIPAQYTTSIDRNLHRKGSLPYMVDGLFATPGYSARNVRLQDGVSDHCAIVAEIARE